MRFYLWILIGAFLPLTLEPLAQAAPMQIRANCDIPGPGIATLKLQSAEACASACQKNSQCKKMVFVSGWNRCFLKAAGKKTFTITMHSGDHSTMEANKDHSGRDQRQIGNIKTPAACQSACKGNAACKAFTYIEGYATCYLKGPGKLRDKVFYCAEK